MGRAGPREPSLVHVSDRGLYPAYLLPPPALGKCRHGSLASCRVPIRLDGSIASLGATSLTPQPRTLGQAPPRVSLLFPSPSWPPGDVPSDFAFGQPVRCRR